MTDIDDLVPDLRGDWNHDKRTGKTNGNIAAMKRSIAVGQARGSRRGANALSVKRRNAPINLPAISILRDKP